MTLCFGTEFMDDPRRIAMGASASARRAKRSYCDAIAASAVAAYAQQQGQRLIG
jgi:hypothetical protein